MTKKESIPCKIVRLMTEYPHLRDSVSELSVHIANELGTHKAVDFAKLVITVDRASRKIQRDNPSLRGQKWNERQERGRIVAKEITKPLSFQEIAEQTGFKVTKLEIKPTLFDKLKSLLG